MIARNQRLADLAASWQTALDGQNAEVTGRRAAAAQTHADAVATATTTRTDRLEDIQSQRTDGPGEAWLENKELPTAANAEALVVDDQADWSKGWSGRGSFVRETIRLNTWDPDNPAARKTYISSANPAVYELSGLTSLGEISGVNSALSFVSAKAEQLGVFFNQLGTQVTYAVTNPRQFTNEALDFVFGDFDLLDAAANFGAGVGDTLTFGLTWWIRESYDGNGGIDTSSGWYTSGMVVGIASSLGVGVAGGLVKGVTLTGGALLARQAANLYTAGGTVWGIAHSSYRVSTGTATAWDALSFVPAAGYALGTIGRVFKSTAAIGSATAVSEGATQFGRMRIAARFLKENKHFDGTVWRALTKDQRRDVLSGIDFSNPVRVRTLGKGTVLLQDVRLGGRPGPWFREPGTTASQVGLWTGGRELIRFRTTLPTQVLETRARPIMDVWTQRGFSVPTEGGGIQFYTFQGFKIWPF